MATLGLSFGFHDSAAALVDGGEVVCAEHEERFSRIKNDYRFPINSANFCIETAGGLNNIDKIVYYEDTFLKLDRIIKTQFKTGIGNLVELFWQWNRNNKFFPKRLIRDKLAIGSIPVVNCSHHHAHAASAYYCSPFQEALVVTIDGVGEWETSTIWKGDGDGLFKLHSSEYPNSLGLLYSVVTSYVGFEINEGEYKLMGLAAYGEPIYYDKLKKIFKLHKDFQFKLDENFFDFAPKSMFPFNESFIELFGPPKNDGADFVVSKDTKRFCDMAASVQKLTENVIITLVGNLYKKYGFSNLCLAGGVALNSLANGKIREEFSCDMFVQPAAGDAGCAIGAALIGDMENVLINKNVLGSPLLGKQWSNEEVLAVIKSFNISDFIHFQDENEMIEAAAMVLEEKKIIGWFNGKSEFGPRALGSRSILADPRGKETKNIVNSKIKFRENFRPFAPAILEEYAFEYFDLKGQIGSESPEAYMLSITSVKKKYQEILPAVTHVDGTARIQIVNKKKYPMFYKLIKSFFTKTGIPILLNTSFNLRGEPIVGSPTNAINSFYSSNLDYLFIENYQISKKL